MLFGGANDGMDVLDGGPDADRFLMPADRKLLGNRREDAILDFASEDAQPIFLDGYEITKSLSPTETNTYTAMNWTDRDVLRVDQVFDLLQREGHGTRLLKTSAGASVVFVRHGTTFRGFNDGWIHMTDASLQFGDTSVNDTDLRGYLLHEIGHNWQGNAFGADHWTQFVGVSKWTTVDPRSPLYSKSANEGNGDRWYLTASGFASNYAKTNENEDFAESFTAFFTDRAHWTYYNSGAGAAGIVTKMAIFAQWLG